ncbi:hypothetical protein EIP91_000363 [Steccherinum ochraceum]|uniref:Uncharacterized protein n=1 Tax=Steccherinum ochraceum TaxID=92696 RepID=A0A4R0RWI7_9APHY|nr:hypothetical protein EIP91_000363 [Steccherinum ochraceum]
MKLDSLRLSKARIGRSNSRSLWEALSHLLLLFIAIHHLDLDQVRITNLRPLHDSECLPPTLHPTQIQSLYLSHSRKSQIGLCLQLSQSIEVDQLVSLQFQENADIEIQSLFLAAQLYSNPMDLRFVSRELETIHYNLPTIDTDDFGSLDLFSYAWRHVISSVAVVPANLPLSIMSFQATVPRILLGNPYGDQSLERINRLMYWNRLAHGLVRLTSLKTVKVDLVVVPQTQPFDVVQEFFDYFQRGFNGMRDVFGQAGSPNLELNVS